MLDLSYKIPPPPRVNVFARHAIEVHILSANGNAAKPRSGSGGALARSSFQEPTLCTLNAVFRKPDVMGTSRPVTELGGLLLGPALRQKFPLNLRKNDKHQYP